ncbi:MAG: HEAT repeat domain-containing protein [Deltaproteobacteria bacterium]|nr:HEAT repeat domain-containing protein [Deltaproteobacteria bacterium]
MVFGLFSKERALKRVIDKATHKMAQHQDRWAAMEKLAKNGSDEALFALFKRFSFSYDKSVEDEQEKQWAVDTLVAKGEAVLAPMGRYMSQATSIAYPLEILGRVAKRDRVLEVVDDLMEREEPGYARDPTKKQQLIDWLAEWKGGSDHDVASRVAPYLADFDEGVRFAATEALSLRCDEVAAPALVGALINPDEESGRLKVRIAEVLAEHDLPLGDHKSEIANLVKGALGGFQMKHDKLRKR